ncbi:MAG: STAS domain-containing protein [Phycisphaerales bacterium]|nr:STAS domain-containing protein [Phycisphaerales bacterium]
MSSATGSVFEKNSSFAKQRAKSGVLTVQLVGPTIGTREAPIVSEEVGAAIDSLKGGLKAVVLDLSDVTFMSSVGLGACINIRNRADAAKATAVLYGLAPDMKKLFKLMKLDRLYKVADSPEALKKITG